MMTKKGSILMKGANAGVGMVFQCPIRPTEKSVPQTMRRPLRVVVPAVAFLFILALPASWSLRAQGVESAALDPVNEISKQRRTDERPFPKNVLSKADLSRFQAEAETSLNLRVATVQQLNVATVVHDGTVVLTLDGRDRVLEIYPHSMRSDDFVLLVQDETGALSQQEPPPITTYRGRVVGDNQSQVAASIIGGQLYATIQTATDSWAVQPVSKEVAGVPRDLHAVYRVTDVIPSGRTCGVDNAPLPQGNAVIESPGRSFEPLVAGKQARIVFQADFEFFQLNSNSFALTVADIEMVMNQVGLIYQNQLGICYVIGGITVFIGEPDPYSSTNDDILLCQFHDFMNTVVGVDRDLAHLMTGKILDNGALGTSSRGVCNVEEPFCGGGLWHYGLSQSRWSTNLVDRTIVTAHELGHQWSAVHCDIDLADCGIMKNSVRDNVLIFGSRSFNAITQYRDSRTCLDTCLDPVFVDGENFTPGQELGTFTFPFNTIKEGIQFVPVGGTVQIAPTFFAYPENLMIHKPVTLRATGGTVTIGQ